MKKIFISEEKLMLLKESTDEVTFFKFFTEVKNFIKELLEDPINAKPSDFFKEHGISRKKLIDKLIDKDVITKSENIDEPMDSDGKMQSKHYIQYKVPKKNFERKLHRLYAYYFERGERKQMTESAIANDKTYNSAAVFVFCKDEEGTLYILGGKRLGGGSSGLYNVPTGCVGDKVRGEDVADAAVREVREESGIVIDKSMLNDIGDEEYDTRYWGRQLGKNYMVMLDGTPEDNPTGKGDGENEQFQWIPSEYFDMVRWAFGQDEIIKNLIAKL